MSNPLTDVILLTYNNANLLDRFFNCIYKHTKDFNLIIVDNGSKDNSVDLIKKTQKKEPNITLVEEQTNLGVAGGRNRGIKEGKAEYVICLDSDQFVGHNWLEELYLLHNKGFDTVGVDAWKMHPSTYKARPYHPILHCQNVFHSYTYVGGGGHLIPRKIFEELNYFDDFYSPMYYEDSDFYFQMTQKEYRTAWHYGAKIVHLGHQTGMKQRDFSPNVQFKKSYDYFVKKWFPYFPPRGNSLMLSRLCPEIFEKK